MSENNESIHVLSTGREVHIRPVSPFLIDEINATHVLPDPPTYTMDIQVSETETVQEERLHDETTLETDEDKQIWEAYQAEVDVAQKAYGERMINALFLKGVDEEPTDEWREEHEALGLPVPDSLAAQKLSFIKTEVTTHVKDIPELMRAIIVLSGIDEEGVAKITASFRAEVDEPQGTPSTGTKRRKKRQT